MSTYDPTVPVYDGTLLPMGNVLQVFNVRQYGATGDGVHDDSTAFQHAANAAQAAGGGVVWVPATPSNNYAGSTTITFASGVSCLLARADTTHPPLSVTAGTLALSGAYVTRAGGTSGTVAALPTFNILDYGATTGATDNATSIQAALNAAGGVAPAVVLVPPGTFTSGQISIPTRVSLYGPGTLKAKNTLNTDFIICASNASDIQIADLVVDGNKANNTSGAAILIGGTVGTNSQRNAVRRCRVINAAAQGIRLYQQNDGAVEDCHVESPAGNGISVDVAPSTANCPRMRIIGNRVVGSAAQGITANLIDSVIIGNTIQGTTGIGIAASPSTRLLIADNSVSGCTNNGIDTGTGTDLSITGNNIYNCNQGIDCDASSLAANSVLNISVVGNTIDTTQQYGILVGCTGGINVAIVGNVVRLAGGHGIAPSGLRGATVKGNTVYNAATVSNFFAGINLVNSSHCVVEGNVIYDDRGASAVMTAFNFSGESNATVINNDLNTGNVGLWTGTPATSDVIRGNMGYNPVGSETVTVPATGVAVAAVPHDRTYYVTAGISGCTLAIQGGPSVVVPAAGMGAIRVPAGKTLTPTFTNAPTWVVEGE